MKPAMGRRLLNKKHRARGFSRAITTGMVLKSARTSFSQAAEETMGVMGYNVVASNGWVVKKFSDGHIERITPIHSQTLSDEQLQKALSR